VGEYDWDKQAEQRGWIYATATDPSPTGNDHLKTCSSVFDFQTRSSLLGSKGMGHYDGLYGFGNGTGLMGDTTDGLAWSNRAVTFVENHDTGYRTNADGTPQDKNQADGFANGWEVEQAYAFILTHPGVPCVFWKHYFDWGDDLRMKIRALINARKVAGVNAGSALHPQDNARKNGIYAAMVEGTHGSLYVRIGGDDSAWEPGMSGYSNFRDYAHGAGWKVWVAIPGNPDVQQAPVKGALPVPTFRDPETISVSDSDLQ
jgi:alpha-amylase